MKRFRHFLAWPGLVILIVAALLVGISDNPPGIILLYCAALALVLAWARGWRQPRRFGVLFGASIVAFFVMAAIHNFAEVGAHRIAHLPVLSGALAAVSGVGFLLAIFVCPMGALVGLVGGLVTAVRK